MGERGVGGESGSNGRRENSSKDVIHERRNSLLQRKRKKKGYPTTNSPRTFIQ